MIKNQQHLVMPDFTTSVCSKLGYHFFERKDTSKILFNIEQLTTETLLLYCANKYYMQRSRVLYKHMVQGVDTFHNQINTSDVIHIIVLLFDCNLPLIN